MRAAIFGALLTMAVQGGPAPAQAPSVTVSFVTLGTGGGPRVQAKRSQPANALVVGDAIYLFDTGDGVLRQLAAAGLPLGAVRAVFLSHLHFDHAGGLGPLLEDRWVTAVRKPIPVIGPPGTLETIRGLTAAFRRTELAPLGLPAEPRFAATVAPQDLAPAMDAPTIVYQDDAIRVLAITNTHYHAPAGSAGAAERSYSYRIEAKGRVIVFTGDTGPSDHVRTLARGADLFVSEVMDRKAIEAALHRMPGLMPAAMDGLLRHMDEDHLTPAEVGRIAGAAGVKKVVLTHLVPGLDSETGTASYLDGLSASFSGPVVVASDLDRF